MSERIEAGEGWRFVEDDELIKSTDQLDAGFGLGWSEAEHNWEEANGRRWTPAQARTVCGNLNLRFRRRITPASAWISVKDRLPEKGEKPIWVYYNGGSVQFWYRGSTLSLADNISHWQPATIPAPPQPEPSEAEKAFHAWAKGDPSREDFSICKESFLAGWEAKEKGKQ